MVPDGGGAPVPEVLRRMNVVACDHDPVPEMADVLVTMAEAGIPTGDVVVDSGDAHRLPEHFALPLRAVGGSLVMDLHPHDLNLPSCRIASGPCSEQVRRLTLSADRSCTQQTGDGHRARAPDADCRQLGR